MLAGRPDEKTGEEIRERGVVLPKSNQAAEQVGTPQKSAVLRGAAAENYVIAATRAGGPAVDQEFLGAEA